MNTMNNTQGMMYYQNERVFQSPMDRNIPSKEEIEMVQPPRPIIKRRPGRPKKIKSQEEIERDEEIARQKLLKKRGRNREKWEVYKFDAEKKIESLRSKLRTARQDKMPVHERMRLRNQISAQ